MIPITAVRGAAHITPKQDAMWHRGIAGADDFVFDFGENFAAEISTNNLIKIRSGVGSLQGRYFCVEPNTYDEVTIANGTQGQNRIDLIVLRWSVDDETKTQNASWTVIQGTPTSETATVPSATEGDLDAGDTTADMPMFTVTLSGITITAVTAVFDTLYGIAKLVSDETVKLFKAAGYPIS